MADPVTAPTRGGADEIREQVARWAVDRFHLSEVHGLDAAEDLLSGPLAPLLALRQRVEAQIAKHQGGENGNAFGGYNCAYCDEPWLFLGGEWGCFELRSLRGVLNGGT